MYLFQSSYGFEITLHQANQLRMMSTIQSIPYDDFHDFQLELDSKYDRHERLVKLSRDCTIKSKRVIFALHRLSGNKDDIAGEEVFDEILAVLEAVSLEINKDDCKHHSAFSPGLQEFIEALSFLVFMRDKRLIEINEVQSFLKFKVQQDDRPTQSGVSPIKDCSSSESKYSELILPLDPIDYVLGIADMTGELMRICVNAVGCGDRKLPFNVLPFMKAIYIGFLSLTPFSKEFSRKLIVLKNSLLKVENVCYTLKIRNSEIPKHIFLCSIGSNTSDKDDTRN